EDAMISVIQKAYYLDARNPSDDDTLIACAEEIGMDAGEFAAALNSEDTRDELEQELSFNHRLGVRSFPTLVLKNGDQWLEIGLDYKNADAMISQIRGRLA
ncbi:MAG: DsbA family protein, partial [Oceanospirillum sp.]|nr:DsbA family protein [Oceanospirillum sp.]